MTRAPLRLAALASVVVALASACGVRGLNFSDDKRVEITSPGDRAEITLPVTIRWTVKDFAVTGPSPSVRRDAGYFGVYVDRAPQAPGRPQSDLVKDDPRCKQTPGCPDEAYLEQRDIHATTAMSFRIDRLPLPTGNAARRREFHEVTIVLLDGRGERIGESAFVRQFQVNRGTAS